MKNQSKIDRYRKLYAHLLRMYPKKYRDRFAESMLQTFTDLCRARSADGQRLFGLILWIFSETILQLLWQYLALAVVSSTFLFRPAIVTAGILMIPAVAMRYTNEVQWTVSDFVVAATMLMTAGFTCELLFSRSHSIAYRLASAIGILSGLLLLWANLAVGIIGDEHHPANLMYHSVIAIAVTSSLLSRFQPKGMACAMSVTALAQTLVPFVAFATSPSYLPVDYFQLFILPQIFVALFLVSALLFLLSSREIIELQTAD